MAACADALGGGGQAVAPRHGEAHRPPMRFGIATVRLLALARHLAERQGTVDEQVLSAEMSAVSELAIPSSRADHLARAGAPPTWIAPIGLVPNLGLTAVADAARRAAGATTDNDAVVAAAARCRPSVWCRHRGLPRAPRQPDRGDRRRPARPRVRQRRRDDDSGDVRSQARRPANATSMGNPPAVVMAGLDCVQPPRGAGTPGAAQTARPVTPKYPGRSDHRPPTAGRPRRGEGSTPHHDLHLGESTVT